MATISAKFWLSLATVVISRRKKLNDTNFQKIFKLPVAVVNGLWRNILGETNLNATSLLWTLYFLKTTNENLEEIAEFFQTNKNTLTKHVREIVHVIVVVLPEFSFDSRFHHWPYLKPSCLVDTTFCRIQRPYLSDWEYFNKHKQSTGLLYQVVVSLGQPYRILSLDGPFKGCASDVGIFRDTIVPKLRDDEVTMADKGYRHEIRCWVPPLGNVGSLSPEERFQKSLVAKIRQVNERVIGRLKKWGFMNRTFRGNYDFHGECVQAIGKLAQLELYLSPLT